MNHDFFVGKSILELAQSQGVPPVKDIGVFAGGIPEEENLDEMLDEIYREREPQPLSTWMRCGSS